MGSGETRQGLVPLPLCHVQGFLLEEEAFLKATLHDIVFLGKCLQPCQHLLLGHQLGSQSGQKGFTLPPYATIAVLLLKIEVEGGDLGSDGLDPLESLPDGCPLPRISLEH